MARVTDAEVLEVLDTDVTPLTAFITAADLLVDEVAKRGTLTDAALKEISRWLSAHFVTRYDPQISNLSAGNISLGYLMQGGLGFNGSPQGQTAMLLDTTGYLRKINSGKPPAYLGLAKVTNSDFPQE